MFFVDVDGGGGGFVVCVPPPTADLRRTEDSDCGAMDCCVVDWNAVPSGSLRGRRRWRVV